MKKYAVYQIIESGDVESGPIVERVLVGVYEDADKMNEECDFMDAGLDFTEVTDEEYLRGKEYLERMEAEAKAMEASRAWALTSGIMEKVVDLLLEGGRRSRLRVGEDVWRLSQYLYAGVNEMVAEGSEPVFMSAQVSMELENSVAGVTDEARDRCADKIVALF